MFPSFLLKCNLNDWPCKKLDLSLWWHCRGESAGYVLFKFLFNQVTWRVAHWSKATAKVRVAQPLLACDFVIIHYHSDDPSKTSCHVNVTFLDSVFKSMETATTRFSICPLSIPAYPVQDHKGLDVVCAWLGFVIGSGYCVDVENTC